MGPLLLVPSIAFATPPAAPRTVERVVATVDGKPIWLSDIRGAALAFRQQLAGLPLDKQLKAGRDVFEQLVTREIERVLVRKEARRLQVSVEDMEVDRALAAVAKQNDLDVPALLKEAKKQGLSEASYRAEIRFQILEGKLLRMHWSRTGLVVDESREGMLRAQDSRTQWMKELRKQSRVTIRVQP
ncbi:MAG: SurA N-terminal domain-containing protein [Polyangiaceae bacterium]